MADMQEAFDLSELYRLLSNLIRVGTIMDVDLSATPAKVRVASGGNDTDWLQWIEPRAGSTTTWNPPTLGEQVIVFCPEGDTASGIVLTGLNNQDRPAPSASASENILRLYPDGARIAYDHASGALSATGMKSIHGQATESATIKAPEITLDGNVTVTGLLTYQAGMAGKNGKGNKTTITGDITHVEGNMSSNGVVVHTHKHRAQGAQALTTEPTQ